MLQLFIVTYPRALCEYITMHMIAGGHMALFKSLCLSRRNIFSRKVVRRRQVSDFFIIIFAPLYPYCHQPHRFK